MMSTVRCAILSLPALHTYKKRAIREGSPTILIVDIFLLLNNELVTLHGPYDHLQRINSFGKARNIEIYQFTPADLAFLRHELCTPHIDDLDQDFAACTGVGELNRQRTRHRVRINYELCTARVRTPLIVHHPHLDRGRTAETRSIGDL